MATVDQRQPAMPAALQEMLAARHAPQLPPVRSEVFGPERFAQHGRSLGLTHDAQRPGWAAAGFFPRLRSNIAMLRRAHGVIAEQTAAGDEPGPAAQWLLDNFYLIDAQLEAIHEGLPRSYFRQLPVLLAEPLAGLPRIYGVAWAYVAHTDSAFDEALLVTYLSAYQETRELGMAEMWALPTVLRVVLVENLRRLAERLATQKGARELANQCGDELERGTSLDLEQLHQQMAEQGAGDAFLAQLGQRLLDEPLAADGVEPVRPAVTAWLRAHLPNLAALQSRMGAEQAADNLSVGNAVNALRTIGDVDWPEVVAQCSPLMQRLMGDPLFAAEHNSTRDITLHGIEELARRSGCSEMRVGTELLTLVRLGRSVDEPAASVAGRPVMANAGTRASYWLEGAGRPVLLRALGFQEPWAAAWRRLSPQLVLPLYLTAVLLGTTAVLAVAWRAGAHSAWPPTLLLVLLLALPASETVIALLHRLIGESAQPRHLPRLALATGIPEDQRVMVVVPAMLSDRAAIDGLVHRLLLHHLANPDPQAQFALLTDWSDADNARADNDAALLAHATAGIAALNAQHGATSGRTGPAVQTGVQRFLLLHRQRSYSASEERWIGWERKRGKLEQLVAELVEGPGGPEQPRNGPGGTTSGPRAFVDLGPLSAPAADTRYIVTLDSDTQLPPGRLRELVGVAAHPANRPVLSANSRRVVAGYGILQPRLVTPLPQPREDTLFHRLFAGQSGVDPYSTASSEIYQDLFDEGSFTGKGLLDVQAMYAVLAGHLPEGQVLSHDLLEGALARCGVVTDITLMEDAPFQAEVAASRVHRWTRGDWQLLPILFRSLLQPARYPLGAVNRWKLADNLRRSLVAPASLALLVLVLSGVVGQPSADGVTTHAGLPLALLALVAAAFGAGPLMGALAGFVAGRAHVARWHFYRAAAADLARALGGTAWHLAMLLQHALLAVDAIARALWRLLVSQRLLLQWTTAAAAQAAAQSAAHAGLAFALRRHWSVPLVAALIALALWLVHTPFPVLAAGLCLLWAGAPLWTWAVSRTGFTRQPQACPPEDAAYLRGVARDTWRTFERTVTAADRHLPPDNLQSQPHEMLAHRTSPTNIGLYLLSTACARQFGWINAVEMLDRIEATLATLDTLPRHRGHFLNWYDTTSGEPLLPMYVSTVDSGNLSGHLLAVAQACLALAREVETALARLDPMDQAGGAQTTRRLQAVAARCQVLAWAPDYAFLYHPRRHLLHIGYRIAEQQLDTSYYDLLASESRLTSLLAIAKGDVPVRHWAALGRPFYAVGSTAGLRSWSGSMFEYLMPTLVLAEPNGSVLFEAGMAAIQEQRSYAAVQGVPWGISESAYAGCDHTLAYQYAPQGVPRLALRRTPLDELVVAPYATALAAQRQAQLASRNYAVLQTLGARGNLGFIEAVDFTPSRQTSGEALTRVCTVMAHHQGMTIVALANVLLDGVAQRWGMADPHLEAVSSLLHERAPREVSRLLAPPVGPQAQAQRRRAPTPLREVRPGELAVEPTQLLSNGRYSVALRANGAGHSRYATAQGLRDINRSRDDALRDAHGHFIFLRRHAAAPVVSLTQHPAPDAAATVAAEYRSVFQADRVSFEARWPDVHTRLTVWVSPEDDIEFRQVEISHDGTGPLHIELISAFEVTLADTVADEAHPAFGNLFVTARAQAVHRALLFERRPRLAGEQGLHMAHFLAGSAPAVTGLRHQVDRQQWLGRNRPSGSPRGALNDWPAATRGLRRAVAVDDDSDTLADAAAVADDGQTLDTGLDPVCVLGVQLRLMPGVPVRLTFATAIAADAATLHSVIDKHLQPSHVERASRLSATLAGVRLRALRMGADTFTRLQSLTTALCLTLTRPKAAVVDTIDRRLLWRFGLSGERPLVLVSVAAVPGLGLVRSLSQALSLWSWGGVSCDLVVINFEPPSYEMPLQRELSVLRDRHDADAAASPLTARTGWHLLRAADLSPDELATLRAIARLRLRADGRPLAAQLDEWTALAELTRPRLPALPAAALAQAPHAAAAVPAPVGAFTKAADAGAGTSTVVDAEDEAAGFVFDVSSLLRPAKPWTNVLANEGFGSLVTEAGGGSSWAVNSRLNQLTPWSNDLVADTLGEWLLLQDLHTRRTWSVSPSHAAAPGVVYRVFHGPGQTRITHRCEDLQVSATWCVSADAAVRQVQLRITNRGPRLRALRLVGVCEWQLGARNGDRASVRTAHMTESARAAGPVRWTALLATQLEHSGGFGGGTAFLAWDRADEAAGNTRDDWTCQRQELFDSGGRAVLPDTLGQREGLGLDPCAALGVRAELPAGATWERTLLLGWAPSADEARQLAAQAASQPAAARRQQALEAWDTLLGATTVATPDPLFDAMVNHWLPYQTVACRLWAKAGYYQAGGATGFRDQLQDALSLSWAAPHMLRAQILRCAARQFAEGDVQHWWHAPGGAGVRTHFSDDLLWLPYAVAHHVARSGDLGLLDEPVPFIEGLVIPEGAEDIYGTPNLSAEQASVYEHAARAIDRSLRVGVHGLPLMGSGDWNDGMNRVGHEGRGESVWLAWFLCRVVADFAPLARQRGDLERLQRWERAATGWRVALRGPAWDGQWYRRAFFDDGQVLGSQANAEARIDLVAQAWAVLSGPAPGEAEFTQRQQLAMTAVQSHLVDTQAGLIRLLHPPLVNAQPSAGYIQAYPPGVRENGGQYSHAGVWAMMALLQQSRALADPQPAIDRAWSYWKYLSPAHRSAVPAHAAVYGAEPYVMAGDVYSATPWAGRGGWSWYTGSAAWMHRAAVESLFGLDIGPQTLRLHPALPGHWPRAELTLRRGPLVLRFLLLRAAPGAALLEAGDWAQALQPRVLAVDEALAWAALQGQQAYIVPLPLPPPR